MNDFLKNLAALIKVKTIVTLVVVAVFAVLALQSELQPDTVMTIVTMVVAFYFGTQTESKNKKEE
uniref:Putative DMT superfamily protein n=1 Tax=Ackermannviridae sp. TaxID=2831612 RepID=A0A8S5VIP5_9CAUD|nr:MAG TPA: putative DMT superfamily protein [Ackermannviridae sp.]